MGQRCLRCARGVVVGLVGLFLASCGAGNGDSDSGSASPDSWTNERVDPQILQDVIDASFWTPGPGVRRGMRVQMFVVSIGVKECGGDPPPLDSTEDRPAQNLYPDLELIRERGFAENLPSYREGLGADCPDLAPDNLESWEAWRELTFLWDDVSLTVQGESEALDAEEDVLAQCLQDRTGLNFDEADPTTFLLAVDNAHVDGATDQEMKSFAAAYAECGKPYFSAFAAELQDDRKKLIERNRELLTRFALEIADAGYVP